MAELKRKDGRLTAYGFACGYVEQNGEHVSIAMEHGVYHVKRSPRSFAGHAWETAHTPAMARFYAAKLAREDREASPKGLRARAAERDARASETERSSTLADIDKDFALANTYRAYARAARREAWRLRALATEREKV